MYSFTCPLEGCNHKVMITDTPDGDDAVTDLTALAEEHLKEMHPAVQKTHEEVELDIRAHMVAAEK